MKYVAKTVRFVLIIFLFGVSSCEIGVSSNETIVTGKVVDESNMPAVGVRIYISGIDKRGIASGITTSDISGETDSTGTYKLEMIFPAGTDITELNSESNAKYDFEKTWQLYIERNGIFEIMGSSYNLEKKNWGKTNKINFQIRKIQ